MTWENALVLAIIIFGGGFLANTATRSLEKAIRVLFVVVGLSILVKHFDGIIDTVGYLGDVFYPVVNEALRKGSNNLAAFLQEVIKGL